MSKQFVAWARVSSARQKKEGFSLEDQELRLTELAGRLGGSVVKLFKIAETASKRLERKTFQEFTTYCSIAVKVSGLGRGNADLPCSRRGAGGHGGP